MYQGTPIVKGKIEFNRFVIPYRIYDNKGPNVVCINGVQQSMSMWHSLITRYAPHYRMVLFDFPDQGKGKIVSGPSLVSLDEQVDILREVIKATGANKNLTICSASWGGVVALAFASRFRNDVKKLCLASLGTKANEKMVSTIQQSRNIDINNRKEMADMLIEAFGQNLPEGIKKKIVAQFETMSEQNLRAFYEHGLFVISSKRLSELINLSNITAKTYLAYGEKDTIIDLDDVKFLASQIPNSEVVVVKDAGHFLHMEREDIFDIYEVALPIPAQT
jgi:pimeloyl-ACP methyl ester carboxylesterase